MYVSIVESVHRFGINSTVTIVLKPYAFLSQQGYFLIHLLAPDLVTPKNPPMWSNRSDLLVVR
jgi:hypothetical protein